MCQIFPKRVYVRNNSKNTYVHEKSIYFVFISGTGPATNRVATVTVDGLECGVTYTITTGGTLDGDLVGLRSSHGNINTGPCPEISPTVSPSVTTICKNTTHTLAM